ncbi:MAG: isomerase [Nannocystis sp.]|nr:isomerase [Nannocystis sp.]
MTRLFELERLHNICRGVVGSPMEALPEALAAALSAAYPGHINEERPLRWIWSLVGGMTGAMTVLHGSLTEYLVLFGTPLGSEGFSGRYPLDVHDFVLAGEMTIYREEDPTRVIRWVAGDYALLEQGRAQGVKLDPGTWLLEYAHGPVARCLPMALSDTVFSALDGTTIAETFKSYARSTLRELLAGKI